MNYTLGLLFIIGGVIGLYHSYEKIVLYMSTGDISYVVKYMIFTEDDALLLTTVNVVISSVLICFGLILILKKTR